MIDTPFVDTQVVYGSMVRRQLALALVILIGLGALGVRLFKLQVLQQRVFTEAAQRNRLEEIPQPAPRGEILDRYGRVLTTALPRYDLTFYVPEIPIEDWSWIERLAGLLKLAPKETQGWQEAIEQAKPYSRVPLLEDIALAKLTEVMERQSEFPGVGVALRTKRSYPFGPATSHLLGYLGAISPAEYERLQPMGYRMTDQVGKGGLEQQYDPHLRGAAGYQFLEVDHVGQVQGRLTEPILLDTQTGETMPAFEAPREGPPLHSTIDVDLQTAIAELMAGTEGAVVVMDVNNGEVLALVSYPSYDANLFGPAATKGDVSALFEGEDSPLLNRTTGAMFIPGSTWKIVTALAGLEEGVITERTPFHCDGVYHTETKDFHCWKLSGHGPEAVRGALADSCDDYFYQVGVKTDVDRMARWAEVLGFGHRTGIDLPQESRGLVGNTTWKREEKGERWYLGDTIQFSMGQGYVLVTPLQLARAYAFIANNGTLVVPHLNMDSAPKPPESALKPRPEHLQIIREGLRLVITNGTGRSLNLGDLEVAGKTGTADVAGQSNPHAWFASFAPYENPRVSVVVLAAAGGHGADTAVPIARQIYRLPSMQRYVRAPLEPGTGVLQVAGGE